MAVTVESSGMAAYPYADLATHGPAPYPNHLIAPPSLQASGPLPVGPVRSSFDIPECHGHFDASACVYPFNANQTSLQYHGGAQVPSAGPPGFQNVADGGQWQYDQSLGWMHVVPVGDGMLMIGMAAQTIEMSQDAQMSNDMEEVQALEKKSRRRRGHRGKGGSISASCLHLDCEDQSTSTTCSSDDGNLDIKSTPSEHDDCDADFELLLSELKRLSSVGLEDACAFLKQCENAREFVLSLSSHKDGCRILQKLIPRDVAWIASFFHSEVLACMGCRHANFVIQEIIKIGQWNVVKFIFEEIASSPEYLWQSACDERGCRFVNRLLELHGNQVEVQGMREFLTLRAKELSMNEYGCYVVATIVEYGDKDQQKSIANMLVDNFKDLCFQSRPRHAMAKVFENCADADQIRLAQAIFDTKAPASPKVKDSPLLLTGKGNNGSLCISAVLESFSGTRFIQTHGEGYYHWAVGQLMVVLPELQDIAKEIPKSQSAKTLKELRTSYGFCLDERI